MKTLLCVLLCAGFAGVAQTPATDKPASSDPVLTRKVEAEYTPEARAAKLQGTVYLYVEVSPEGKPENVQVMHGLGMGLDEKAVEAVKQWLFTPGTKDGKPQWVAQSAEVQFRLEDAGPWRVRQAAYTLTPAGMQRAGVFAKPVLSRYASPDPAACPAGGGAVIVETSIGKDGLQRTTRPQNADDPMGVAAATAVESWAFLPGKVGGERRSTDARIEFECGATAPVAPDSPVYRIGNRVTSPVPIYKPEPQYSEEARKARYNGAVTLSLVIDPSGHATRVRVIQGPGLGLDEKALEALTSWRFKPGTFNGAPVSVLAKVVVNLRLF
jgi:TonB family protein